MLKKGDIVLGIIVVFVVILGFSIKGIIGTSGGNAHRVAVVMQENKVIKRIDLDSIQDPVSIEVGGKFQETILAEKGRVRFAEANCPDRVCVRTGWISKKGDSAVCIPNRTVVRIEGVNPDVDSVAY